MVEATAFGQTLVERTFAGMAKRRMAKIVGERAAFGQVLVEAERTSKRAGDLGDLKRVG